MREIFLSILARRSGLSLDRLDVDRPLVSLGLDSLGVSEVLFEFEEATGFVVDLGDALAADSIRELLEELEGPASKESSELQAAPGLAPEDPSEPHLQNLQDAGDYPLSEGQRSLYYLQQLDPESTAYHLETAAWIEGRLVPAKLQGALIRLCRRHSALRTSFPCPQGQPLQRVATEQTLDFGAEDGSGVPPAALLRRAEREIHRPFDVERGPLFRVRLWTGDDRSLLLLVIHHGVADLASLTILWKELATLYGGDRQERGRILAEPAMQFHQHGAREAAWLESLAAQRYQDFWRDRLEALPKVLTLPTDRPRPQLQSFQGRSLRRRLAPEVLAAAREVAARNGTTLFGPLLATWQAVLGRWSGQRHFSVGSLTSGRLTPDSRGIVGYLVNPCVLGADLRRGEDFQSYARRLQPRIRQALGHARFPFARLVESHACQRDSSRSPLFQVLFALQTARGEDGKRLSAFLTGRDEELHEVGPWRLRAAGPERQGAQFDLTLMVAPEEGGGSGIRLEYCTDLFDATTVHRILDTWQRYLENTAASGQAMDDVPILGDGERQHLLVEAADTEVRYRRAGPFTLASRIRDAAGKDLEAVALRWDGGSLTYRQLLLRSGRRAAALNQAGAGPETIVALELERGPELIISVVACLRCGAAFLPIDPDDPPERKRKMLDLAAPVLVLRDQDLQAIDGLVAKQANGQREREEIWRAAHPESLAYVHFTSGSTGEPKGVLNRHGGLLNRLLWMQQAYGLGPGDRVLQKTPATFDVSVWEMLWPLMVGAQVVVAPPAAHRDPELLTQLMRGHGVSVMHCVPSLLRELLREPGVETCSSLRLLICSGEALAGDLVEAVFETFGQDLRLDNLYGPTEAAIDVSSWRCASGSSRPPALGRPIANLSMRVLDEVGRLVPPGSLGELYLGGEGLGRGYLRDPARTAASFLPDPWARQEAGSRLYRSGDRASQSPGGPFYFQGRLDRQVKLRGMRLELEDVESALRRHPGVKNAVAVLRSTGLEARTLVENRAGDQGHEGASPSLRRFAGSAPQPQQLVAYFETAASLAPEELRRFLLNELPAGHVPAILLPLDSLPRTASGKVDRRRLPDPEELRPQLQNAFVRPSSEEEKAICASWSKVLGVTPVGIDDNFFHLGGDSIRSLQVRAELHDRGWRASVAQMQRYPTPRTLAPTLEATAPEATSRSEAFSLVSSEDRFRLPPTAEDAYPLSRTQSAVIFHAQHEPGTAMYRDILAVRCRGPWRPEAMEQSVQAAFDRHPMLRSSFHLSRYSEPLQVVHREVVASLTVADRRDLGESSEAALVSWMEEEKGRPLSWREPPLVRFFFLQLDRDIFALALSFFDAVLDGWSAASLVEEVLHSFAGRLRGESQPQAPLAARYRDFIRLESEALSSRAARQFWQDRLAAMPVSPLPRWRQEEGPQEPRVVRVEISRPCLQDLERLAEAAGVPLKTVLLAAHLVVLDRHQGARGAVTGVEASGRPEARDGDQVMGMHVNVLPLALVPGSDALEQWVRRVHREELAMAEHRRFPYSEMTRLRGREDWIDTVFNYTRFHILGRLKEIGVAEILGATVFNRTSFALRVDASVHPLGRQGELTLAADQRWMGEAQVEAFASAYRRVLAFMRGSPARHLSELQILSPGQRHQLVTEWNNAPGPPPPTALLHGGVEARARRSPWAIAAEMDGERITYQELESRACALAAILAAEGIGPETVVAVAVGRSLELLVTVLGVLKAGAAFLPLNRRDPRERQQYLLERSAPQALVTARWPGGLPRFEGPIIDLEAVPKSRWKASRALISSSMGSSKGLAYLLFTSGSTGRPKAVAVSHGAAASFVQSMEALLRPRAAPRLLALTPLSFDISILELFWTWHCGGTVILTEEGQNEDALSLLTVLQEKTVDWMQATPTTWRTLIVAGWEGNAGLKILCGGEELPPPLARQLTERGQEAWNLYGPTEATVWSAAERLPRAVASPVQGEKKEGGGRRQVPFGRSIANTGCHVLDESLRPVPMGVAGELFICGQGLARGYWRDPALTAAVFVPNPFTEALGERMYRSGDRVRRETDGRLVFLGRMDEQLKIRGHRVEPGEIAAQLELHPQVGQAVVVARSLTMDHRSLVAYVVPAPGGMAEPRALRAWLSSRLPMSMVPSFFVAMTSIPRTSHGKVDRGRLPSPDGAKPSNEKLGLLLDQLDALSEEEAKTLLEVGKASGES